MALRACLQKSYSSKYFCSSSAADCSVRNLELLVSLHAWVVFAAFAWLWLMAGADLLWENSTADWLVAGGWCWFSMREQYCWLVGWQAKRTQRLSHWNSQFSQIYLPFTILQCLYVRQKNEQFGPHHEYSRTISTLSDDAYKWSRNWAKESQGIRNKLLYSVLYALNVLWSKVRYIFCNWTTLSLVI